MQFDSLLRSSTQDQEPRHAEIHNPFDPQGFFQVLATDDSTVLCDIWLFIENILLLSKNQF